MVEIAISGRGEFERAEADVIQRLIINAERLVSVLHQLMHRQRRIVWLDDCIRHLCRSVFPLCEDFK